MYGAILGDIIGSPYEFDRGNKSKDFPLFSPRAKYTDDTVMTIAVADALLSIPDGNMVTTAREGEVLKAVEESMRRWGNKYWYAGYGTRFRQWLRSEDPQPYNSWGNGSAMRVSAAGWMFLNHDMTRRVAELTAMVTHNHPEGIKGANVVASAIFAARVGWGKDWIKSYAENNGYDLSRTCDEIRPTYHHVESCQETVPQAITAFLEGNSFEDAIRNAVSLGGDCDTLTCITGSIAEAYWGVPEELKEECKNRIPEEMVAVLERFDDVGCKR
ncbi:MAG: ADP-ribosylglycohydrolase family protein [Clostridia bacterium]|nr:ADP-ribosylglycohydrolase family protein [Clostridia bacterium]